MNDESVGLQKVNLHLELLLATFLETLKIIRSWIGSPSLTTWFSYLFNIIFQTLLSPSCTRTVAWGAYKRWLYGRILACTGFNFGTFFFLKNEGQHRNNGRRKERGKKTGEWETDRKMQRGRKWNERRMKFWKRLAKIESWTDRNKEDKEVKEDRNKETGQREQRKCIIVENENHKMKGQREGNKERKN